MFDHNARSDAMISIPENKCEAGSSSAVNPTDASTGVSYPSTSPKSGSTNFNKFVRPYVLASSVSVALTDAASMGMSLRASGSNNSMPTVLTNCFASFVSSIGLNGGSIQKNLDEINDIIQEGKLPPGWDDSAKKAALIADWPTLSRNKELASILLTAPSAICSPLTKGIESFFFLASLPSEYELAKKMHDATWYVIGGTIATGASFASIPTDVFEVYKSWRKALAGVKSNYTSRVSGIATPLIGYTLSALKSLHNGVKGHVAWQSCIGMVTDVGSGIANYSPLMYTASGINILNMGITFWTSHSSSYQTTDEFIHYVSQKKFEPKKVAAFSISLGLMLYLALCNRQLNEDFYSKTAIDCGLGDYSDILNPTAYILSVAMMMQEALTATSTIYSPMYGLVEKATTKLSHIGSSLYQLGSSCYSKLPNIRRKTEEQQPLLPTHQPSSSSHYQNNNPSLLFSHCKPLPSCAPSASCAPLPYDPVSAAHKVMSWFRS